MKSKFRIKETRIGTYIPQRKFLGLFWVPIPDEICVTGAYYTLDGYETENKALQKIEQYKEYLAKEVNYKEVK